MAAQTIAPGETVTKSPNASKVYQFDWTLYLAELGADTITTSTFLIAGDAALYKDNESIVAGALKTKVRLIGGALAKRYTVTNRIVTSGTPATTDERSFIVLIADR